MIRDSFSIVFAAASFIMAFAFNQLYNKSSFQIRMERNPHERKRAYVKRVFCLNDYAKEIRLNPEIPGILFQTFEQANDDVYRVEKRYAGRRFFLGIMRRYVSNAFFSDVLYISYLVFQAMVRGALDPIAEYQLNHAMLSATKDKTVIFISHRLSTTRLADRIIMLEQGRIAEQGSHEQLLERNGKYAQM